MEEYDLVKLYSDLFGYEKLMKEASEEYKGYSGAIKVDTPRMKFLKDVIQDCAQEITAIQKILRSIS
jgi:hypothetical protein